MSGFYIDKCEVKAPIVLVVDNPLVILVFFGDKIAILTMTMIFYKLLAIVVVQWNRANKRANCAF